MVSRGMRMMRRRTISVQLDEAQRAKLHWVAGRRGKSAHAFAKAAILAALVGTEDPPAGFGMTRRDDEEDE